MKSRQIVISVLIIATMWQTAAARDKKTKTQIEAPPIERLLTGTDYPQSNNALSELIALTPAMPLGPQDILKSYELAMSLVADRTANNFAFIVQAQQTNQITREQAESLLQQQYQTAMMQYQVLSALHDILQHDLDEATQKARASLKIESANTILTVPLPGSPSAVR